MKNTVALIALMAALPSLAAAQENNGNIRDNDGSVIIDDDNDGTVIVFDDIADDDLVDDLDIDDSQINVNLGDQLLVNVDDISVNFTEINAGLSGALNLEEIANTVLSATAVNSADIDGSINIASIGQSASAASDAADTAVSIAAGAGKLSYESASAAIDGSLGAGTLFSGDAPKLELKDLDLAGNTASEAADLAVIAGQYARSEVTSSAESTVATIQEFGDVGSVAAGALNTATFDVSETAGETVSSSAGETLTTLADATDSLASGSGLFVSADALNSALINGSITANLDGGDVKFTSISSVAAGALNTVTVDAELVGRVGDQIKIPN